MKKLALKYGLHHLPLLHNEEHTYLYNVDSSDRSMSLRVDHYRGTLRGAKFIPA